MPSARESPFDKRDSVPLNRRHEDYTPLTGGSSERTVDASDLRARLAQCFESPQGENVETDMLTIYRRHVKDCGDRAEGRKYRRCRCPIWADGALNGVEVRESLDLRDWERAQHKVREWEAQGAPVKLEPNRVTIAAGTEDFLRDAEARNLREPSIYKYRLLFRSLKEFATQEGFRFLDQLDLSAVRKFRASWPDANLSALKKLERLRAFFRYAHDTGWVEHNPAKKLKNPKVTTPPTLPFSLEQIVAILAACESYPDNYGNRGQPNAKRLRAFVLVLRYAGLRIRDTATLRCDRLAGNKLFLYTAKTGVPVRCPVPDFVVNALESCPRTSTNYFFWTGESEPKSTVGDWQRSLRKLFRLAGITDGHAHRFRDTFAIELLLAGVPLERVSMLLGHQSVKVTERHYAPWVLARQEQLV